MELLGWFGYALGTVLLGIAGSAIYDWLKRVIPAMRESELDSRLFEIEGTTIGEYRWKMLGRASVRLVYVFLYGFGSFAGVIATYFALEGDYTQTQVNLMFAASLLMFLMFYINAFSMHRQFQKLQSAPYYFRILKERRMDKEMMNALTKPIEVTDVSKLSKLIDQELDLNQ